MPCPQSSPLIRFVCWVRSLRSVARSRVRRRRSSSSGLGGRTIEQTRRSPRAQAMRVRRSISPSIASVLARRCRRLTAIEAGSTTWLSIPLASSRRCSQKPSSPASWTTETWTGRPIRRSAVALRRAKRLRSAAPSPPATACPDSLSLPGASTVTSHRDFPSSSAAKSLLASSWPVARIGVAGGSDIIGCLHAQRGNLGLTDQAVAHPHRIFFGRLDALRVDDGGARARLPAVALPQHHHEVVADGLPHARVREAPHVAVDRPPGREGRGRRQVAPLAARAHEVEQPVEEAAHVRGTRPAAGLRRRDQGHQKGVPLVAEGLPGAEVADQRPGLGCPHGPPPGRIVPSRTADLARLCPSLPEPRCLLKRPLSSTLAVQAA